MAKILWTGAAQAVAQVDTITIGGTVAGSEEWSVTINNKTVTYTSDGGDDTAAVAAGLQSQLSASTIIEFGEVDWTVDGSVITATSATDGVPFTVSVTTDSASGTITLAAVTAATGPNHWDNDDNWSGGSAPGVGDEWYVDDEDAEILYGLPTGGTLFAAGVIEAGQLGLPNQNAAGYVEYRTLRAAFGATVFRVGRQGAGPTLCRADLGTDASEVVVYGTSGTQRGSGAVDLIANNASTTIAVLGGTCDVAMRPGDTTTVASVTVGSGATVRVGEGTTVTTLTTAGQATIECDATTLNVEGGQATLSKAAAIATLNISDGDVVHRSSGTITTANVGPGRLDMSADVRERTITNCTMRKNGLILDPYSAAVFTNGVELASDVDQVVAQ